MAKIVSVVGNVGVGKTTLTKVLADHFGWINCSEQHAERPFQEKFTRDRRYAVANQVDYLLLRAEQERDVRSGNIVGIFDGGLDMDMYVFSQLFLRRGYLDQEEFGLLQRLYRFIRGVQPGPDVVIHLSADSAVTRQRYLARQRLNIAQIDDMDLINLLLENFVSQIRTDFVIKFDGTNSSKGFPEIVRALENQKGLL